MTNRMPAYRNGNAPSRNQKHINETYIGESIESRVEKIMSKKEPITDGAPQIFTNRKDGVLAEYNIRTDRFEEALNMTDQIYKNAINKRQQAMEARTKAQNPPDNTTTTPTITTTPNTPQTNPQQ